MRFLPIALCFAGGLHACSSPPPPAATPAPAPAFATIGAEAAPPATPDIGDAEFRISCSLTLAPERDAAWTVRELKDHKGKIAMVTADIPSPPASLPVVCTVSSEQDFADTPVAVRARLMRETTPGQQQEIGNFHTMASATQPTSMTFDALKELPAPPETMLLTVELTLLMTPAGTDPATLDPATVQVAPEFQAVEMSNPLRVNFAGAPAQQPETENAAQ